MNRTGNTILITGGGTGIGRGLAEAFHRDGNQVILAGRRRSVLEDTARANSGMRFLTLDVENLEDTKRFGAEVRAQFPALNALINNAGIMKSENLKSGIEDLGIAEQTVAINVLGTIRMTAALMPVLPSRAKATIMTVSSGLAFVPIDPNPSYCASKAAIHSWTQSMIRSPSATFARGGWRVRFRRRLRLRRESRPNETSCCCSHRESSRCNGSTACRGRSGA